MIYEFSKSSSQTEEKRDIELSTTLIQNASEYMHSQYLKIPEDVLKKKLGTPLTKDSFENVKVRIEPKTLKRDNWVFYKYIKRVSRIVLFGSGLLFLFKLLYKAYRKRTKSFDLFKTIMVFLAADKEEKSSEKEKKAKITQNTLPEEERPQPASTQKPSHQPIFPRA